MNIWKTLPASLLLVPAMVKAQTLPIVPIYTYTVPGGGYAPNGNLTNYIDSATGTWNLQYDSLNRVQNAAVTAGYYNGLTIQWQYDSFGNRSNQTLSGSNATLPPSTSARYDDGTNRITSSSFGVDSSSYDATGNLIFDGLNHIAYDAENRVCAVLNSVGTLTQYLYNAEGQRVAKGHSASGNAPACPAYGDFVADEKYILGQSGEQITQLNGQDQWQHSNVYVNGQLLATYDQESATQPLHFNVIDPLGTKRVQTSDAGAVELSCVSLQYGDGLSCNGTGQDATEHHFTGKERDAESGLDNFGFRYYASTMGRFMSPDDDSDQDEYNPQSWNLYSYVHNNPLTNVDPDGHDCVTQTRTSSTTENVSVSSGQCTGASGNGTTQTYVDGTVKLSDIHAGADGHSIDIGYTDSSGNAGVFNANSAPIPDNPGIAVGYHQAGFNTLANASLGVKYVGTPIMNAIGFFMGSLLSDTTPLISGIKAGGPKGSTYLYEKLGPNGEHLKYGITNNPTTRYSPGQLAGGRLKILAQGSRAEMLQLERSLHETMPIGPEEGQSFYIQKQVNNGLKPPPY
jgi:RHS repeat-associated protein